MWNRDEVEQEWNSIRYHLNTAYIIARNEDNVGSDVL